MKDEIILRLLEDACAGLKDVCFPVTTPHLIPVYNALLDAAKANHPDDGFLRILPGIERPAADDDNGRGGKGNGKGGGGGAGPEEMRILFGQLRIVLESLREETPDRPRHTSLPGAQEV